MTTRKDPSARVKRLVRERDGDVCLAQGRGPCAGILTLQHRIGRGMGGSRIPGINHAANLIVLCFHHNGLIETDADFRSHSLKRGWSIPRNWTPAIEPADIPVRYQDGPYLLDDEGNRELISEGLAAELWSLYDAGWAVA